MKHKALLIGSNGFLGSAVLNGLRNLFDILPTSKNRLDKKTIYLDVTDLNNVIEVVKEYNPTIIINCSAFTDVDMCEVEKSISRKINVVGVENIIKAANKRMKIIHISSDYVFDGENGPYSEDDLPNPLNYYGRCKLESENVLIGSTKPYVIFRPNVLFNENLCYNSFFSWVINSLNSKKEINIVDDQISNPTYIPDLINAIFTSTLIDYRGILHIGSNDFINRYEFSKNISKIFNLDNSYIKKIKTCELNQTAKRPLNSSLKIDKIKDVLNLELADSEYNINLIFNNYFK